MNIHDPHSLLTAAEINVLQSCLSRPFTLGVYTSLGDILSQLGVDVLIEPGKPVRTVPEALNETHKYWLEEVELYEARARDDWNPDEFKKLRDKIGIIQNELYAWSSMKLRGLYEPDKKVIRLYPEAMRDEFGGQYMDELLVSTLAHETMHAYFDRPGHEAFPYVIFVEEPLAEFGMLLYLHETGSNCYSWAYQDVKRKRTCYRFGAALMDNHLKGNVPDTYERTYLTDFKVNLPGYPLPTMDASGKIVMPVEDSKVNTPVSVGGQTINPHWQGWFFDSKTNTAGMDGEWGGDERPIDFHIFKEVLRHASTIYLADNFILDINLKIDFNAPIPFFRVFQHLSSDNKVFVSPANKQFYSKNGVLFFRNINRPVLFERGFGLYELSRNGKYGVVNAQLNQVVPFKYDSIYSFDNNGLSIVKLNNRYGLVNIQGQEQVPVEYEDIRRNYNGTYTVKKDGAEFVIDRDGNRRV